MLKAIRNLFSRWMERESKSTICQSRRSGIALYGLIDIQLEPGDQIDIEPCECEECRSGGKPVEVKPDGRQDQQHANGCDHVPAKPVLSDQFPVIDNLGFRKPDLLDAVAVTGEFTQRDQEKTKE